MAPDSVSRNQEYQNFKFRRRHDHFLRFKLMGAKRKKIIETARELGFKLNIKDLPKKKKKKQALSQNSKPGVNAMTFVITFKSSVQKCLRKIAYKRNHV